MSVCAVIGAIVDALLGLVSWLLLLKEGDSGAEIRGNPPWVCRALLSVSIMYGVATISRLLKMIGLFCKRALENR